MNYRYRGAVTARSYGALCVLCIGRVDCNGHIAPIERHMMGNKGMGTIRMELIVGSRLEIVYKSLQKVKKLVTQ